MDCPDGASSLLLSPTQSASGALARTCSQLLLHHYVVMYVKDVTMVPSLAPADVLPLKCSGRICAVSQQTCHLRQSYAIGPTAGHILVA